jgi:hypothetical protein
MNATGNIEQNMRTTGQAYQQAYAFGNDFATTTEQTLQTIALQTPYVGGRGVYSARVMLDIDNWMFDLPYKTDPMEVQAPEAERTVKLYPVPADRDLMIQWNLPASAHIVVYDVRGMAVLEQDAHETGSLLLDVSGLAKGVYILSLEYTDGTTESHQVILGK